MQHYNCSVNVGGNVHTRVPKTNIPAPEVSVLRHIHGNDAVLDIVPTIVTNHPNSKAKIRADMEHLYGKKAVDDVFGKAGALPLALDDVSPIEHLIDDDEPAEAPATAEGEAQPRQNNGKFQKKAA